MSEVFDIDKPRKFMRYFRYSKIIWGSIELFGMKAKIIILNLRNEKKKKMKALPI